MNNEWKDFLVAQGAEVAADGGVAFAEPASDDCNLFDLSHFGLIAIEGPEADTFLQGQVTNDVRELTEQHSQLSSHCSPKGRMLANFRLLRRAGVIHLQLPMENLPKLLQRLNMFKLRAQVKISDVSDQLVRIGCSGSAAADLLRGLLGAVPEQQNGVTHTQDLTVVRMPGHQPRFEILGPLERVSELWLQLSNDGAQPANKARWALGDIRAGVPMVLAQTVEAFVPQMANMQLVDGVSFTKGCYTGQEVVARMQYLGKLKRRMYRAEVRSNEPPLPGNELFSGSSDSGQGAGRVVDAQPVADDRYELLAVVEIAAADAGDVRLGKDGPGLRFMDLPYTIPEVEKPTA